MMSESEYASRGRYLTASFLECLPNKMALVPMLRRQCGRSSQPRTHQPLWPISLRQLGSWSRRGRSMLVKSAP